MTRPESSAINSVDRSFIEACRQIEVLFCDLHFFNSPSVKMPIAEVLEVFANQEWQQRVKEMITEETLGRVGELIAGADHSPNCDVKLLRRVVRRLRGLKQAVKSWQLSVFLRFLDEIHPDVSLITDERLQALERNGFETIEIPNLEMPNVGSALPSTAPKLSIDIEVSAEAPTATKLEKVEDNAVIEKHVYAAMLVWNTNDAYKLFKKVNAELQLQGKRITKQQVKEANCRTARVKSRRPRGTKKYSLNLERDFRLKDLMSESADDNE